GARAGDGESRRNGASAPDEPGASRGYGAQGPGWAGSAVADGSDLAGPVIRGGTREAGDTLPLPVSLPQDDAVLAGQPPAAALAPTVAAAPLTAPPLTAAPLTAPPPTATPLTPAPLTAAPPAPPPLTATPLT